MSDYKYHLLNITLTIFCSDMGFHFLCRPYLLYPVMGICMIGSLEEPFIDKLGVEGAMRAISVSLNIENTFIKTLKLLVPPSVFYCVVDGRNCQCNDPPIRISKQTCASRRRVCAQQVVFGLCYD